MSEKLLSCPFCGSEGNATEDGTNAYCDNGECGIWGRGVLVKEWNKRFAYLDSNGTKVFAGDEVEATCKDAGFEEECGMSLEPCIEFCDCGERTTVPLSDMEFNVEITLIESEVKT